MGESVDSSLIQENLEEYVNDENKIVTYRWLSLTLNINVNNAKQALYTFATSQRNKGGNDDINVTYFVAGLGKTKQGEPIHKCVVVPECHLDIVKSELEPVTSCHVYSVQKCKLKDTTSLYQTDYDIIRENLTVSPSLSSIVCPWAVKHDPKTSKTNTSNKPSIATEKEVKKEVKKEVHVPKASPTKTSNTTSSSKKKGDNKGSIASMFASAGKKTGGEEKKNTSAEKIPSVKEKAKATEKKGGVKAFFSTQPKVSKSPDNNKDEQKVKKETQPEKSSKKTKRQDDSDDELPQKKRRSRIKKDLFDSSEDEVEEEEEEEAIEVQEISEEEESHNTAVLEEESEEEEIQIKEPETKKKKKEKEEVVKEPETKGKKKEKEEVKEPDTKKKKKEKEEVKKPESKKQKEEAKKKKEVEEIKTKETVSEEAKEEKTVVGNRKRKRTRKLVPKHSVDEEGFMVTEKVWESDSTDASDVEEVKKVEEISKPGSAKLVKGDNKPKAPKKSVAVPTKGKQQASI